MTDLDFDGDYGLQYQTTIRDSIPGYDVLHEIAIASVNNRAQEIRSVLVVGPGPGEKLISLLNAAPKAGFTVLEPSKQMMQSCKQFITQYSMSDRCNLKQLSLEEAIDGPLNHSQFDLVVCHNVLHLFSEQQQISMLQKLLSVIAKPGALLLSGFSEPNDQEALGQLLRIGRQRLINRGVSQDKADSLLATRNTSVFSMNPENISTSLRDLGFHKPLQLYQGLFAKLWLITND